MALTADRLRGLLVYQPDTGLFFWRVRRGWKALAGDRAGRPDKRTGRWLITIDGVEYFAARLAWLYRTGVWPDGEVDHKNGDPADDRFDNLRDASHETNQQNQRRAHHCNKTGFLGVHPHRDRFHASISIGGRNHHIGAFDTPEEAHEAYLFAKRQVHKGNML